MESGGFFRRVSRPPGRPPRKIKSGDAYSIDSKNLFRLKLGKTETEFFSTRGNNRLKRIWLENDLDEEMIFASWIGPSKALLRQKVSDYMQTFLMRRTSFLPYYSTEMFAIIKRLNELRASSGTSVTERERHGYLKRLVKSTLERNYERREKAEKERVAKSIANEELPPMPGFEYVQNSPVFKANQIEKKLKKLNHIPMPFNEEDFEMYLLPIMTAFAIFKEERKALKRSKSVLLNPTHSTLPSAASEVDFQRSSSGFSEISGSHLAQSTIEDDSDLIQVFSEMDLATEFNDTCDFLCDTCGGLTSDDLNSTITSIHCTCLSGSVWDGKNQEQTATALYKDASKIVEVNIRKQEICSKYMEKYEPIIWLSTG